MVLAVSVISSLLSSASNSTFLLAFPIDTLFSTQGIMVMLLVAYAGAMWMFLTSAPKVHTIMVSDLEIARQLYEGLLDLPAAEVPLHYYYNYEQTIGAAGAIDPLYMSATPTLSASKSLTGPDGLWYQLKKNTQLHVISGAFRGEKSATPCLLRSRLLRASADARTNSRFKTQNPQ